MGTTAGIKAIGVNNSLVEIEVDTQLSDYIANNYEMLVKEAVKFVDWTMAETLVHDVYLAIRKRELAGEGYQVTIGKKGDVITPRQCVFSFMKKYGENSRYRKVTEAPLKGGYKEIPCSVSDGEEYDTLTIGQKAYASIASVDDIEMKEEQFDLVENMSYLVSCEFNSTFKYSVMSVLHNIITLVDGSNVTDDIILAFKSMNPFEGASTEFVEAFKSVMRVCSRDISLYKRALEKVKSNYEEIGKVWG